MGSPLEKTAKLWKVLTLLAIAAMAWGLWLGIPAIQMIDSPDASPEENAAYARTVAYAAGLFFGGLAAAVFSRIAAWWFHG